MNTLFQTSRSQRILLKTLAKKVITPTGTYYYIPWWFRDCNDFTGNYELYHLDGLPDDLKETLLKDRENGHNEL